MPVEKLSGGNWPHPARLPLGCGWSGHCTAPGHDGETPSQDVLEAFCNLGYASSCGWAPQAREWDAVRFAVSAPSPLNPALRADALPARFLKLIYICERDHRPVSQGELVFDLENAAWLRPHDDARVQKMAECFVDTYLKRKS